MSVAKRMIEEQLEDKKPVVNIVPIVFENARTGEKRYGYQMYGDNLNVFDNSWDSIPGDDVAVLMQIADNCWNGEAPDKVIVIMSAWVRGQVHVVVSGLELEYDSLMEMMERVRNSDL